MDKKVAIITLLIILLIGGGVVYLLSSSEDRPSASQPAVNTDTAPRADQDPVESVNPGGAAGTYADYDATAVSAASGTKLLFFHAPWCPQCRDLEADIKKTGVPAGVTIFKVDYDSNQALRQKYGITIQTTVVRIDDQGNLVEKYVAYDEPTVESIRRNLL